ncbi:hypothetical protein DEA8626_02381 [Defluviimonas aquaemixtae]|uniref:TRAP transporter small permease protein n=1 Tax=Albidovulum aquaemixtae TaxID=1542388 RepID=A0A2R8B8B3_9RHOB|nr:TRAP transporter small permease [Defluviimonas aquaemixtae]SPH18836.1 hypothetical protein DEA8626_02381 [Defluviimonas aquaemixtae]
MPVILGRLADAFAVLGGAILLIIVGVTTANAGAFILDRIAAFFSADVAGLPGYEDFVQLMISGAALMFFPYCQAHRGHVSVDLFMERMPQVLRRQIDRAWLGLTAGMALFLAYWMIYGLIEARADGVLTSVLGWPVWPFYLPGIASMILWALVAMSQLGEGARHA